MKIKPLRIAIYIISLLFIQIGLSQEAKQSSEFWKKVQFGGGLGLGFGNNATNISVSPSAIYNVNEKVAFGLGVQYSYINQKNFYTSHLYGGSIIGLVNPIKEIQLSVELEELRVNTNFNNASLDSNDFWNTALFLGAGYRTNNIIIGARYNVLHKDNNTIYTSEIMPFVRVFF